MIFRPEAFVWMKDHDWFDFDENEMPYLTEKATEEAIESFEKYKELRKWMDKHPERLY